MSVASHASTMNDLRIRSVELNARRTLAREQLASEQAKIEALKAIVARGPAVRERLEHLGDELFKSVQSALQHVLSLAIQEVLQEPVCFAVEITARAGTASLSFSIQRDGMTEDVMRGQGGSVANILSVGLRFFALTQMDTARHRQFLVLDEQDCWLRPDLVPKFVKIVRDATRELGIQTLMISHHDITTFERYADRIYQLRPSADGVRASLWELDPAEPDVADVGEKREPT